MPNTVRIDRQIYAKLPVRKTKAEAKRSAEYWRERGHSARLIKGANNKYYVAVRKK